MTARRKTRDVRLMGLLSAVLLAADATPATARQGVRGTVVDGGTGEAVAGAMVVLIDAEDRFVGRSLTGVDGGFRVGAPEAGLYRLRVDRIGYGSTVTDPFRVAAGETVTVDVSADVRPVELVGLEAEGRRRCEVRPATGLATARVWEEARKALSAARWTAERELYRFSWSRYERVVAADGRSIRDENRTRRRGYTPQPFRTVDPAELIRDGFVRPDGDGAVFDAPDASVLLSEPFLDTHCFGLERKVEDGRRWIGLRFRPVPGRAVPDVAGVMWLEEAEARLREVEYRYVNLGRDLGGDRAGGHIRFRELPNGTWIVQEWRIRMPTVAADRDPYGELVDHRVIGFRDEGGVVEDVRTAGGEPVPGGLPGGVLRGTVIDSARRPARGARVRVAGTSAEATTSADGRFAFSDLGGGVWTVRASHASLEAVGDTGVALDVELTRGSAREVRLTLPSVRGVVLERCEAEPPGDREGILAGRVVDEEGHPVDGADVRVFWALRSEVAGGRALTRVRGIGLETSEDGTYVACGVPLDGSMSVYAEEGERFDTLEVPVTSGTDLVFAESRLAPTPPSGRSPRAGPPDPSTAAAPFPVEDSLWLASKGFWLRAGDALAQWTPARSRAFRGDSSIVAIAARAPRIESVRLASGVEVARLHPSAARGGDEACDLTTYLNGRAVRRRDSWARAANPSLAGAVDPAEVLGLEVFEASSAPVGDPGGCGAILAWSPAWSLPDDPEFTGRIEGRVTCAADGSPLPGVEVELDPTGARLVTDAEGRFAREGVPPTRYRVDVDVPGWGVWSSRIGLRAGRTARVVMEVEGSCGAFWSAPSVTAIHK